MYHKEELRVGLTDRELRYWIKSLVLPPRGVKLAQHVERIANEMQRAVDAATRAGITNE